MRALASRRWRGLGRGCRGRHDRLVGAGAAEALAAGVRPRRRSGRQRPCLDHERRCFWVGVHEAHRHAPVFFGEDLRRDVHRDQLEPGWQHDLVALDAERAVEDDQIAVAVIALGVLVGLVDAKSRLSPLGHRTAQPDLDVARVEVGSGMALAPCLLTRHHLELERLAGREVDNAFVGGFAALANGIEEVAGARRCRRDVVKDAELRRVGGEQLVGRVVVGLCLRTRARRRLRRSGSAPRERRRQGRGRRTDSVACDVSRQPSRHETVADAANAQDVPRPQRVVFERLAQRDDDVVDDARVGMIRQLPDLGEQIAPA